jgi:hypothetical protein
MGFEGYHRGGGGANDDNIDDEPGDALRKDSTHGEGTDRYGYGVTTGPVAPPAEPGASVVGATATDGPPAEREIRASCAADATRAVFRRLSELSDAYDAAETAMYEQVADDPDVRRARARWSTCMGGGFGSPPEVAAYVRAKADRTERGSPAWEELRREEMALAGRDLACRAREVDPVFGPKLAAARERFVAEHRELLAELRAAMMEG